MEEQNTDDSELTTKQIREKLYAKILVSIIFAVAILIGVAAAFYFFWPFIKSLL